MTLEKPDTLSSINTRELRRPGPAGGRRAEVRQGPLDWLANRRVVQGGYDLPRYPG